MGFTIDMGSGELVEESSTQKLKQDKLSSMNYWSEFESTEPELSIVEHVFEDTVSVCIPDAVAHVDIDTFVDKFS